MPFQSFPLRVIGGTNQNRSPQANNELTKNWYPELTPGGLNDAILLPWKGSQAFGSTTASGGDRGTHIYKNEWYQVKGSTLYLIGSGGTYTSKGTIGGAATCVFSNSIVGSSELMVIAAGTAVYTYDGTTLTTTSVVSSTVTYLNSKSIYATGGQEFSVSGASGPGTITSTGSAESSPDDLLRPYAFQQWVWMFCETSVEPFYDSGATTGTPLKRVDSAIKQKGLGGLYTVANTDQFLYFLGDDFNVYRLSQGGITNISTPSLVNNIKTLNADRALAYTLVNDNQDFYILKFETGLTYVFSEQLNEWFNLSTGVNDGPYLAQSYQRVYDKDLAIDGSTGDAIELLDDLREDLGQTIQRRRVFPPFTSKQAGMPYGKRLLMSKIKFALQTGQGIVSGQGSDPRIMVEFSLDGGETWSTERWVKTGKMGKFLIQAIYNQMVTFDEITFRVTVSDPVFSSLHDASIDVKLAGY